MCAVLLQLLLRIPPSVFAPTGWYMRNDSKGTHSSPLLGDFCHSCLLFAPCFKHTPDWCYSSRARLSV